MTRKRQAPSEEGRAREGRTRKGAGGSPSPSILRARWPVDEMWDIFVPLRQIQPIDGGPLQRIGFVDGESGRRSILRLGSGLSRRGLPVG